METIDISKSSAKNLQEHTVELEERRKELAQIGSVKDWVQIRLSRALLGEISWKPDLITSKEHEVADSSTIPLIQKQLAKRSKDLLDTTRELWIDTSSVEISDSMQDKVLGEFDPKRNNVISLNRSLIDYWATNSTAANSIKWVIYHENMHRRNHLASANDDVILDDPENHILEWMNSLATQLEHWTDIPDAYSEYTDRIKGILAREWMSNGRFLDAYTKWWNAVLAKELHLPIVQKAA